MHKSKDIVYLINNINDLIKSIIIIVLLIIICTIIFIDSI